MRLIDADWLLDVVENIIDWDTERDRNRIIHQVRELTPTVDAELHWISVTERLPEVGREVLTYTGLVGLIEIQSIEKHIGNVHWENQHGDWQDLNTVTAWMPLPKTV